MMVPLSSYQWRILDEPSQAPALAKALGLPLWVARVLCRRGHDDLERATRFLEGGLEMLPTPDGLMGLGQALEVLVPAITEGRTLGVAGDYDADGVTSTALLVEFLRGAGARVVYELPQRLKDGYGFTPPMAERLAAAGAQVIITVDCGTSDHDGVARAHELGLEVVVSDHHQLPPGPLPPARAVINPQQPGCGLPPELAGAGVAFYLAAGLRAALRERGHFGDGPGPNLLQALDLVALGTLADVSTLTDCNRILVRQGLQVINQGLRPGLRALATVAGKRPPFGCTDLNFALAPRINAAGRLGSAGPAVELLLTPDPTRAMDLARKLDRTNQARRQVEQEVLQDALERLKGDPEAKQAACLVMASPDWHRGVLGIVASRLVEIFHKPVMLFNIENGRATGSGRAPKGFHLQKALTQMAGMLSAYGGHARAAAATLPTAELKGFALGLIQAAAGQVPDPDPRPTLELEPAVGLDQLGPGAMGPLERLAPFGPGNPEPLLAIQGAKVLESKIVGEGHLKLELSQGARRIKAIGFNLAGLRPPPGSTVDLAAAPQISTFRGRRLELLIKDLRPVV